jgi:EAL domain-containing protein (putative c-di-GMP-specific phosphodiesterase class I)
MDYHPRIGVYMRKKGAFLNWIKTYHKILTTVFSVVFIIVDFLLMKFVIVHNPLAFTHVMYIPIILIASTYGLIPGIIAGFVAGFLSGPLLFVNPVTEEVQPFLNWVTRMMIMVISGAVSGLFGRFYQQSLNRINDIELRHPESGLYNINYLRQTTLVNRETYTVSSLIISNQSAICEVAGYEAYYEYIKNIKKLFKETYINVILIQPAINQIWILKPSKDFQAEIHSYLKLIQDAAVMGDQALFVDYAMGFYQQKHLKEKDISAYFVNSDIAANEARAKNLTYLTYSDVNTRRQFEYELLTDFSKSLHDGSIYMIYQPKVDLKTKKPTGLEALIRWNHPTKKQILPDQFISAVEKTNMIHDMTQQVFRWSLEYQKKLNDLDIFMPISINISTRNLYDENFFKKMMTILNEFKVKPKYVELEITETVLMENPEMSKRMLEQFSNEGFSIAIDDFGKGYSSLAYLAQFPINIIKIDRIFTRQILVNPTTQHIVKATIDLAKQLGYEVLIEGIEDKETADLLERLGCHSAQGYYYLRPKSEDDVIKYLRQYRET